MAVRDPFVVKRSDVAVAYIVACQDRIAANARKVCGMYSYEEAPSNWKPAENSPEQHYYQFTKFYSASNGCPRVDFDGKKFVCYHESMASFKDKERQGVIHSTWDTYRGMIYPVEHRLVKNKE